ncbi:MotA/TolQ/ExbB proton channel family protein [Seleniivibrio woodruffii]|uniref:MotA/TolQ/ExbB proton channel family protein n=1 Tax=Seleniivibrio woodruffii TaxID=1078050 RepID=UPI0026EC7921|nr:MotA/TolQ/ExbB proton channel family protein [Seleniivibrio woodruffii]
MFELNMELMQKGGVLMYPIVLLSVIALAVFFERLVSLRESNFVPKDFMERLMDKLNNKDIEAAKTMCAENKSSISIIASDILKNLNLPFARLAETAEESGRFQAKRLERFLPTLQAISTIAPMLGFLGTVFGMIKTFMALATYGAGNAQPLAAGIAEALITTAAGLCVAIPTMAVYYFVRFRSERITTELEKSASRIMNAVVKED